MLYIITKCTKYTKRLHPRFKFNYEFISIPIVGI